MGKLPKISEIDFSTLNDETAIKTIKTLYSFNDILEATAEKTEPAILARYLIELSQNYSNFYNENKIIDDNPEVQNARVFLTKAVGEVLKIGAGLLGIKMPNKMSELDIKIVLKLKNQINTIFLLKSRNNFVKYLDLIRNYL